MRQQLHLPVPVVRCLCLFQPLLQLLNLEVDDGQFDFVEQLRHNGSQPRFRIGCHIAVFLGNHVYRQGADLRVGVELEERLGAETLVLVMLFELVHDSLIDRVRRRYLIALQGVDDDLTDGIDLSFHFYGAFSVPHHQLHQIVEVLLQRTLRTNRITRITRTIRIILKVCTILCYGVFVRLCLFVLFVFLPFLASLAAEIDHFVGEHFLAHVQPFRAVFDIDLPGYHIRNDGDGRGDVFDERSAFLRVVAGISAQQCRLETDKVGLVLLDIADELCGVVALCIAVRVFAVRQQHHFDVKTLFKEHVYTPQRRVDTCRIAVIENGDVTGEALDEPYLRFGERRAAACHHILDSRLVHGDDIHLTFHQIAHVCPCYRLFGLE